MWGIPLLRRQTAAERRKLRRRKSHRLGQSKSRWAHIQLRINTNKNFSSPRLSNAFEHASRAFSFRDSDGTISALVVVWTLPKIVSISFICSLQTVTQSHYTLDLGRHFRKELRVGLSPPLSHGISTKKAKKWWLTHCTIKSPGFFRSRKSIYHCSLSKYHVICTMTCTLNAICAQICRNFLRNITTSNGSAHTEQPHEALLLALTFMVQ